MKTISFITSEERAKAIQEQCTSALVTIQDTATSLKRIELTYKENQESIVIQSIFHAGIIQGINEAFKTETV